MKRPLAGVIIGYAAGILLGHFWQPPPMALWCGVLAVAAAAGWRTRFQVPLLWLLLVLSGWANLASHAAILYANDLRALLGEEPAAVRLRGMVAEPTQIKLVERRGNLVPHSLTVVTVTGLSRGDEWQRAEGRVLVMTPGTLGAQLFKGQSIEVAGAIERPALPLADGLFDDRDYLATRGIYYELKANSTNDWQLAAGALAQPPWTARFLDWSQTNLARGLPEVDEPLRLIWAMTLGWRTAFTGEVGDPFLRAGTMHLFAIDGLRIALVSGMILTLLRTLRLSRAICGLVCVPVLWFYTAATGWEPSAVRASVMMSIIIGGWMLKRPGDLLNSLAAAAFIILAWNPQQMFEAGFQLSFLVVLIIGLMLPPLNELTDRILKFDPLVPADLVPKWQKHGVTFLRWLGRLSALSLAAWIGSVPLSARYFNLFSPVSPPANVVAVPLGMAALMSNLGSLVCGDWFPWATIRLNHSAWFFMLAMTRASQWAAGLPGAYWYVTAPSWTLVSLYYAIVVAALIAWVHPPKRRLAAGVAVAGLMAAASIGAVHWIKDRRTVTLTILPLSGGQTVFAEGAGTENRWLINCGNESAVEGTLKPFLRAHAVNRIPQLLLTTGDAASCGGADRLAELYRVDELFTSPAHFRSANYRDFVAQFDQAPERHRILRLGDAAGCWQCLHPGPADNFPRGDDNALVLRGRFPASTILLLANLGRDGQDALLARTNDLRADIVISALPAQGEALCDALLRAVNPKVIVIAEADYPVQHRATATLKRRLEAGGIPVIYTRMSGAVTIAERPAGWEVKTMDGRDIKSGD